MTPTDPTTARQDMARLRAAIDGGTHWIFATDDAFAARTLRTAAGGSLFVETVFYLADRGEAFPLAVLAVSKKAWPPSAAARVAEAAARRRAPRPDIRQVRGGADWFPISRDPERLAVVLELIRLGEVSADPPPGSERQ